MNWIFILAFGSAVYAAEMPLERIYQSPDLSGDVVLRGDKLLGLKFSPNGERLGILKPKKDDYEILDLWEIDLKTYEQKLLIDSSLLNTEKLSEEEKARRERMRINRKGIVDYFWSHDGTEIIIPASGDLYGYDLKNKKVKPLIAKKKPATDIQFSPHDHFISFVRDQNLMIYDFKKSREYAVTTNGKGSISYGVAEFVAQEEMGRMTGYWWSQDEKYLAFTQVDESPVKELDRYDIDADKIVVHRERYPEAGKANAIIKLAVIPIENVVKGKLNPIWIDLGKNRDIYLTRADWNSEHKLIYQIQTRDQKRVDILSFDPKTKTSAHLFTQKDDQFVNLQSDWKMLKKTPRMIAPSEKTGFKHLYLCRNDGKIIRSLTQGEWPVDNLVGIDESGGWVYFLASMESPLERHLYRTRLDEESKPEKLTKEEGWHGAEMSAKADLYVEYFSSPSVPPRVLLHKSNGELVATLMANEVKDGHPLYPFYDSLIQPEFGSFKGPSGDDLYFRVYKPKGFDSRKKYPLIVFGYGGPHGQTVQKQWGGRGSLFHQYLATQGYVVASFDNRGSPRRGKKFEAAIYHSFGKTEVEDQVAGVKFLASQGYIDENRIGFYGWSYGGYLSLNLAFKASDWFKANVAVAPVTDLSLYDTHYTERYLGMPQFEKEVYREANALNFVKNLKGRLLVIHGMADDNVLFSHSTLLFKNLQQAGKLFESQTYPGAKHGIKGKESQTHVFSTIADFFKRYL
jgi:dipeptidyl-peptidase 4